jgi:hypothetical protein
MIEFSITTFLKLLNDGFTLVSKVLPVLPKKVPEKIHDEASFLALVDPKQWKPVREVDTRRHYYEWMIYVERIVFEKRRFKDDINSISFNFTKDTLTLSLSCGQQMGHFGKRLRQKAEMLREGDPIIIRGYFLLYPYAVVIVIKDIERI